MPRKSHRPCLLQAPRRRCRGAARRRCPSCRAAGPAPDPCRIRRPARRHRRPLWRHRGGAADPPAPTSGVAPSPLFAQGHRLRAHLRALGFSTCASLEGLEPVTGWLHGAAPRRAAGDRGKRRAAWRSTSSAATRPASTSTSATTAAAGGTRADRRVLNCFCYTGGFSLQALAGGAASVVLDRQLRPGAGQAAAQPGAQPATRRHACEWREADVFQANCAACKRRRRSYDLIILDPPKFAPSAAHAERGRAPTRTSTCSACRCSPGGLLMTYSCSGGIGLELFQKIVADAAHDAGREARIVRSCKGNTRI
jgi:16S rRNA G966 N2-methylase RsmD